MFLDVDSITLQLSSRLQRTGWRGGDRSILQNSQIQQKQSVQAFHSLLKLSLSFSEAKSLPLFTKSVDICNKSVTLIYMRLQTGATTMYTTNECGVLNNYAYEVPTYPAQYPTSDEQCAYALQGAAATLLVTLLVLVGFAVS
jgi:hypothetical protein